MNEIYISTGKEILDLGITKFEVVNGAWIGEISIRNNHPHLYCKDYGGNLVNSFSLSNKTKLDLIIKPIEKGIRRIENPTERIEELDHEDIEH